jgi:hypothetical protein
MQASWDSVSSASTLFFAEAKCKAIPRLSTWRPITSYCQHPTPDKRRSRRQTSDALQLGPADQIAKWKNPGREILNRGWHLSESWLQENKGSLRKLLQRLCGHGLLVPTVKKATP